jgi:hypothetical protein
MGIVALQNTNFVSVPNHLFIISLWGRGSKVLAPVFSFFPHFCIILSTIEFVFVEYKTEFLYYLEALYNV